MSIRTILMCALAGLWVAGCSSPGSADYRQMAGDLEKHLERDVIRAWFPRCVDWEAGGFHANFSRDWTRQKSAGRFIVFQARQTWITSQIAMRRADLRQEFLRYVRHGLRYLDQVMWDREYGGFFWGVDDQGQVGPAFGTEKHLYGQAFGIYAAAAAYEAAGDQQALDLAMRAFRWVDEHAHDAKNGGYHECLTREGRVIGPAAAITPRSPRFRAGGFIYGYKSMNAHIHMLEALTELYRVSRDPTVQQRLQELLAVVRDRIAVEPGCLNLWFTEDWRAVPDHDSFGHDVETAFLLIEASEALGNQADPRTLRMARMLVDHALDFGWDQRNGGFFDKGYAFSEAFDTRKVWWTQVEGLNSLLLMHERFGKETDRYWKAFQKQWEFIVRFQIDPEHPGLFEEVEADGKPAKTGKGHNWKAGYHDGRSMLNVADRLSRLASQ